MPLGMHGHWDQLHAWIHEIVILCEAWIEQWLNDVLGKVALLAHEILRTFLQVIIFVILLWKCLDNWLHMIIRRIWLLELVLGLQKACFNLVWLIVGIFLNIWAYHFNIFLIVVLSLYVCGTLCANLVHLIL